jgi:predicted enzyme related to lactoylglutathione lyase
MEAHLARVVEAGGVIEQDKRLIAPEIGYLSTFIDTEGNRMAFFSRP